jgi:hypothetical protein
MKIFAFFGSQLTRLLCNMQYMNLNVQLDTSHKLLFFTKLILRYVYFRINGQVKSKR